MVLNPIQLGLAAGFVTIGLLLAFGVGFIVGMWYQASEQVSPYGAESPTAVRRPAKRPATFSLDSTLSTVRGPAPLAAEPARSPGEALPPPRAATPAPDPGVAPSGTLYLVQVGSFQARRQAEDLRRRLAKQHYPVRIQTSLVPQKGIWYRVRVGPFTDRGAADRAAQQLVSQEQLPIMILGQTP